jgi:ribulose-phosphate 3-epimerase
MDERRAAAVRIWPSLLAADLADLAGAARAVEAAADGLHVDMMDGRFVPNLTMGPPVLAAVGRHTHLPLEAHLMVETPAARLEELRQAGAMRVVVHAEASRHLQRVLARIRELGMQAGVALNPATPLAALEWLSADVDSVLVMAVNPGFGGQRALEATYAKIAAVRAWSAQAGRADLAIAVDGGMDADTAPRAVAAGATDIVAGTAVFAAAQPARAAADLRARCLAAVGTGWFPDGPAGA